MCIRDRSYTDTFNIVSETEASKLLTINIPMNKQFSEISIKIDNLSQSGSSSPLFYIIQKDTNVLLNDGSDILEKNYLESHVELTAGIEQEILNVSNLIRELKGGFNVNGRDYIILLYVIDLSLIHI